MFPRKLHALLSPFAQLQYINFALQVIACKPSFPTYLQALNPTDQVFDFEELEYHYQVANRTEDAPSKDAGDDDDEDGDEPKENKSEKDEKMEDNLSAEMIEPTPNNSPTIDNPYLRAAKIPKWNFFKENFFFFIKFIALQLTKIWSVCKAALLFFNDVHCVTSGPTGSFFRCNFPCLAKLLDWVNDLPQKQM